MTLDIANQAIIDPRDDYAVLPSAEGWEIHFNGQVVGRRPNRSAAIHAAIVAANGGAQQGLKASVLLGDGEGTTYSVWQSWVDGYSAGR